MRKFAALLLSITVSFVATPAYPATGATLSEPVLAVDLEVAPIDMDGDANPLTFYGGLGALTPAVQVGHTTYFISRAPDAFTTLYRIDSAGNFARVYSSEGPVDNVYSVNYTDGNNLLFISRTGDYFNYATLNLSTLSFQNYPTLRMTPAHLGLGIASPIGSKNGVAAFFASESGSAFELYVQDLGSGGNPVRTGYITETPGDVVLTNDGVVVNDKDNGKIELIELFDSDGDGTSFELLSSIDAAFFYGSLLYMPERDAVLASTFDPGQWVKLVDFGASQLTTLVDGERIVRQSSVSGTRFITQSGQYANSLTVYNLDVDLAASPVRTISGSGSYLRPVLFDSGSKLYTNYNGANPNRFAQIDVDSGTVTANPEAWDTTPFMAVPAGDHLGLILDVAGNLTFSDLTIHAGSLRMQWNYPLTTGVTQSAELPTLVQLGQSVLASAQSADGHSQRMVEIAGSRALEIYNGPLRFFDPIAVDGVGYLVDWVNYKLLRISSGQLIEIADFSAEFSNRYIATTFRAGTSIVVLGNDRNDAARPLFLQIETAGGSVTDLGGLVFDELTVDQGFTLGDLNNYSLDWSVSQSENYTLFAELGSNPAPTRQVIFSATSATIFNRTDLLATATSAQHIFELDGRLFIVLRKTAPLGVNEDQAVVELDANITAQNVYLTSNPELNFYPLGIAGGKVIFSKLSLDKHPVDSADLESYGITAPGLVSFSPDTGFNDIPGSERLYHYSAANQISLLGEELILTGRTVPEVQPDVRQGSVTDLWAVGPTGARKLKESPANAAGFTGPTAVLGGSVIANLLSPQYGDEPFRFAVQTASEEQQNSGEGQSQPTQNSTGGARANPLAQAKISSSKFSPNDLITLITTAEITRVMLGNQDLFFRKTDGGYQVQLPAELGVQKVSLLFYAGSYSKSFVIEASSALRALDNNVDAVIKRNGGSARVVLYDLVGSGKAQIFVNGRELVWINAKTDSDPKLRTAPHGKYLVRTFDLAQGKNVIEVYQDGERLRRVSYGR